MEQTTPALNTKVLWAILQFTLPLILAIVAGYGSVRYASGENQSRMQQVEQRVKENREDLNRIMENQVSRREMQLYIDQTRSDLAEIKSDLRELRKR